MSRFLNKPLSMGRPVYAIASMTIQINVAGGVAVSNWMLG
jgi:hypothetical protein